MLEATPIPAFTDNYIWALSAQDGQQVAVVDPGDAAPVEDYLKASGKTLAAILVTHHHKDHTGGIKTLLSAHDVPVFGPANSPYKGVTHPLNDGETIELFGQQLQVKAAPGHTLDHILYFIDGETPQLLCGDTLFLAGCGRLFEGTPEQMLRAMDYFNALPDATEVYCTHEYSLANLKFAAAVEPDNASITEVTRQCEALRANDTPTLPSTIAQERRINPFLRTREPAVIDTANRFAGEALHSELAVFTAIREWKNQF